MDNPVQEKRGTYPLPGPGLLIALSSSGWVGLLSLISFGADSGYAFVGITFLTLLFKYALITGLARFTIATGTDIFTGLGTIPGPKNWVIWMMNGILYIEIFMLGYSSQIVVRLFNELFGVNLNPFHVIIGIFGLLFLLVALDSYWFFREILIRAILFIMLGFGLLILSITIPIDELTAGIIPDLNTYIGVYETGIILSSVGSGFSLLFYSVWMVSHLRGKVSEQEKPEILRRARIDAGLGMVILFLLCGLFYSIGYVFFYEHGLGAPEPDLTLEAIFTVMNLGIYGNMIFACVCITALFCSLLGGLYGRARVLEVTLPRTIPGFFMSKKKYLCIVFVLVLSAVFSDFFFTQTMVREFIAIRMILFSILGILLIWIDRSLHVQDRGSVWWYIIMATGTVASFIIGINLIEKYIQIPFSFLLNL